MHLIGFEPTHKQMLLSLVLCYSANEFDSAPLQELFQFIRTQVLDGDKGLSFGQWTEFLQANGFRDKVKKAGAQKARLRNIIRKSMLSKVEFQPNRSVPNAK